MNYSKEEVLQYVMEEDVKFIRLAFSDVFGKQKNISIMPHEMKRAFDYGIALDASSIAGFGNEARSDLLLHPETDTLMQLPWRPEHGKVVRMFSAITYPDGTPFECDCRNLLKKAVSDAERAGYSFSFGAEQEFYLFKQDEEGRATKIPYDEAGYMDIAPDDKGENIRREICLTLEQMGISPESSHHEDGPGQNEIDFRYSDALAAADNTQTFQTVVRTVADRNGLVADFSAKPLEECPGNGFHINLSFTPSDDHEKVKSAIAGILARVCEMSVFLNPTENSYKRFGRSRAPKYVSWSEENRSQLIRIPAAPLEYRRLELRSPDPSANPYIAFTLMIYAALEGIYDKMPLQAAIDENLFNAPEELLKDLKQLPGTLEIAKQAARKSEFIAKYIPQSIVDLYCR